MIVQFLPGPNRRWQRGKVLGLEADGSVRISAEVGGAKRAIRTSRIKRQHLGPRGGTRWELIDDTE